MADPARTESKRQFERPLDMLLCPDCGRPVGAVIHPHEGCDRVNGLGVLVQVVPRSVAEALASAIEAFEKGATVGRVFDAVDAYRAKYPKETP